VISSSYIHLQVVRITGLCSEEEAEFSFGVLQWSLGMIFSRREVLVSVFTSFH